MSFASKSDDSVPQLFVIEDLTPGFCYSNSISFQSHSLDKSDDFSHNLEDELCNSELMQNSSSSFSAEHDLVDTRTIQTRRQSARIGAKKIKKADCKREEEVFEYCRQTKRSDAITRSGSKLSLHLKKNNPIRRRRLKSHLGRSQDSSNHSSDSEENDPERLWCICRKPHDERFMICCDLCDEWYHGDCVGIKPEEGKRMEKNEIEFVCDSCKLMGAYGDKTDNVHSTQLQSFLGSDDFAEYSSIDSPSVTTSVSTASGLTASIVNSLRLRLNEEAEKECDKQLTVLHNTTNTALKYLSEDESSVSESFSTSVNSTEDNNLTVITNENELPPVNGPHVPLYHPSVGVTDTLQSVHLPKSFLRRKKKPRFSLDNESTEHVNSMNACLGPNCNRTINPQISLYCSNKCLKAYGMDVLRIVCRKHGSDPQDKSHHLDTHKTLVVLDRRSGTVLNGTRAPTSNNLIEFLSVHQTFQVVYDRQSNERSQKSTSLNQTTKCSVQNEASARTTANVIKNSEQDFCRSPSSLLSEPISQQSLVPENVDRLRKKYQNLLLVLLEKRTQASRHIFTANRSRLKMLAEELETVISTRNNLINSPAPTDANSSFEQDLPTYKCQLRLFLSCLDAVGQDKSQHCPVPSSTTDPSIILRDQFFDSLISGVLKPSDLAHCQNIKTLESIVRRARLADSVQNKISLGTSVVSSNVNTNQPDLCATSTQTSTTITPSNNPLTSVPALSQPTEVDKHTNEALDTTSEHGKHLYDMHCKRCTGQTKQPMKLPSSKKSVPSPSPPPSSGASLSLLSVKTESVSNTFSSEKISPDPNSTELSLSKSSISPAAILAEKTVPVSVKLSPKSADECSVFNKPNYLEDRKNMVKCLDPRKESISLQNSVNHHMSKMQLNQKRSHPSFEEYCPVSIFTHDKSIPPKSLSSCYHPPPPINSFVSTGLLDLPLPPAQHNSSFTSQSDDNDSVSPPYIVKEKINSKCCLWTGMLSLSTQYSGREHMYSLEINVHPFGYIHAKVSNDSRKVFIENTIWESLLSSKQTSLVISRGVNLVSLPVYLGQTLLDSTHPRELFALHVTPRTKQMSHIYADIFNHLKEINACGSLEPRFQGTYDCLLYPLIANTHLPDILLPPNLLSKFEFIGCDVMTENHLLIILTRPVYVTPSVVEILSPFPSSPTSNDVADEKSTTKAEILAVGTTTDISSPVPLNIETYPSMSTSLSKKAYMPTFFQQPIEEEVLIKDERQEVPTIETVSINASGDVDLRPFSTAGNVSQSHSVIPEWFPSFTEDVDYRTYIPQQHTDRVPCVSQTLCNISSQSVIDDCNRSHSLSRFREKAYYLTPNERIHYVEQQIGYPRKELKDHVLRDSVTNRSNSLLPSPLSTDSSPRTIHIPRASSCALLPTPSVRPSNSSSYRRSSSRRRPPSPPPRSSSRKTASVSARYHGHHQYRRSRFRR